MGKTLDKKTLWMRWVSFAKIRDILLLIKDNNGKFRAKDLEQLGIQKKIFLTKEGKPFSHSTTYHYRKVMEHLNIVVLRNRRYWLSENPSMQQLMTIANFGNPLMLEEKLLFSSIVITNEDCRRNFFDIFMPPNKKTDYNLSTFIESGLPITYMIETTTIGKKAILANLTTNETLEIDLRDRDKINAILWGIRLWCLDELEIIDDIFLINKGIVLFPINQNSSLTRKEIISYLFGSIIPTDDWTVLSLPELTYEWSIKLKISTEKFHEALDYLYSQFPDMIVLIPTSPSFIRIMTPFEKRDKALFKGYLRDKEGRFISHMRIHKRLLEKHLKIEEDYYGKVRSII
jgi:hypothetical protein